MGGGGGGGAAGGRGSTGGSGGDIATGSGGGVGSGGGAATGGRRAAGVPHRVRAARPAAPANPDPWDRRRTRRVLEQRLLVRDRRRHARARIDLVAPGGRLDAGGPPPR